MEEQFNLTERMKSNLLSGAKWLKFLAVVMTIMLVFLVIAAICLIVLESAMTHTFGAFGAIGIGVLYLICVALYIYPLKKAFNLVSHIRQGVNSNSQEGFEEAADDFDSGLKYMGALTIIGLILYAIGIICAIGLGIVAGMN